MSLANKNVIITGGGSGLGYEFTKAFLEVGSNVTICGRRESIIVKSTETILKLNTGFKDKLISIKADMSQEKDVISLFKGAKEKFGSVDILINNAGVWGEKKIKNINSNEMDDFYSNNLKSVMLGTKIADQFLSGGGSIINIGSFAGILSIKSASLYSTFKAAIGHFTKSAAYEFAKKNIRVNCVIPGVIETPMTKDYINEHFKRLIQPIALNRLGKPNEVAAGVLFLCSDSASYITGINLEITGGKYLNQL